ncbi:CDP-6-deoxy-delta-3,4-glucoseen reductase [Variovorax sp. WS11]|uniref:CDP-6-deoxy-delta-3,4-glucoseen reductase n=1 Tax=Variovorax sp. WS11 TaxID=1105204 RepID=UPI000D0DEB8A|nr:CDP-6-deoxy-delta-3,4-glucoseen reductase [Variovorax sp. WS11]NDZ18018.1 CDP-6-deoxy-delta-3,4-glucoseen reductase [Variovorax sp. WS11]PSL80098.1 CDP-6-deoxy-delta-3,4-glucoseen reductase [Variovorax sp. WS11]
MSFSVRLKPSDRSFSVEADRTVLGTALANGIGLPYSCSSGICRTCCARVVEGSVKHKFSSLSAQEEDAGFALLCQAMPLTDLVIEAQEVSLVGKIEVQRVIVSEMRLAAPDVMVVTLRLPPRKSLNYLGGQYLEVLLPDGEARRYSLATVPQVAGNWEFDLHIRHCPGGRFTDHVFGAMKARSALTIRGPLGTFFLREDSDRPIILVASGTGYAPIRALLGRALEAQTQRDIWLYWGARSRGDLYLADEPRQWAERHERLRFVPVLSEPLPSDHWQGRTGFVHQAVMADFPDLSGMQAYACGAPAMVDAARRDFVNLRDLPAAQFFADAFLNEADLAEKATTA